MSRKIGSFIVFAVFLASGTVYAIYEGCFEERVRSRHFNINPGDFRPEATSTKTCSSACGAYDYKFAALAQGKFCYCGNTLPSWGTVADSNCDVYCVAEPTQRCGGLKHVSVHSATKAVAGLSLSSDVEGQLIRTGTPVTLDVSIATGMDVIYQFDYDDGAGRTSNNVTDMLSRTFSVPGEYNIQVFANDVNQTFPDSVAATAVKVEAPPGEAEVECDPVFATYEEGNKCTVTVWSGTSLSVSVDVQGFSYVLAVPDPPLSLAGLAVPSKEALAGDATARSYLLLAAQFSVAGRILAWEMNVETLGSGTIKIGILKPQCTADSYCYGSNACGGTCHSTAGQSKTCLASEQFCGQAAMCHSSCAPTTRYDETSVQMTWEVVSVHTVTATTVGYQYIPESSLIEVEPGYILGVQQTAGAAVLGRVTVGAEQPDVSDAAPLTVGGAIDASSATGLTVRHAIRAVASGGTKVHLPFIFTQAGNFTLTATATSSALTASPASTATTNVLVEEGVNLAIITSTLYAKTSQGIPFEVEPHTGNNVLYNWTISDGTEQLKSTDRILTHTFLTRGQYQVNVTVYNSVSSKENTTDVIVEDEILGLSASTPPTAQGTPSQITLGISSGSDYTCTWDFGDSSPTEITTEAELTAISFIKPHLYLSANTYQVSVTCANNVSSLSVTTTAIIQSAITNLRMTSEGANKWEDFYIRWEVDAGTDIAFNLTFDGNRMTSITEYTTNKWQTDLQTGRTVSEIPLTLTASNLISSEAININFKILTAIVNPTFTSATINATSGESITFTADMDAGSDATITVSYRDGTSDSHVMVPSTDWSGPVTFTHAYHNGGIFEVTAKFSNAEATYYRYHTVNVLVGVQNIRCELPEFALYHPPAEANLMFIGEALPTEPTLTIHWGEQQSRNTIKPLTLNTTYLHKFGDTGILNVVANITNLFGTKICNKTINIVEKLVNPNFKNTFPKAGKGLPYEVTFCLHRGPSLDQCNLTFDFGNGVPATKIERAGAGKDGCDRQTVIYTDATTSKNISVIAETLLETDGAWILVDVIQGFEDSDLTFTVPPTVTFGVASNFEIIFTGTTPPEGNLVKVSIDYGDGTTADSGPHDFTINAQGDNVEIQHVYAYDSTFTAQVTVFSDCCSVTQNVSVGVYKAIANVQADLYFLADIPPNQMKNGLEDRSVLYPTNKALHFNMTNQDNAFVESFDVSVNAGGSLILQCQKTTPEFSILLNDSGSHTINVQARNPSNTANMSPKTITMYELIEGFIVEEVDSKVGVFEAKIFNVRFDKVGTDTCVYVDFGDGSKYIYSDNLVTCTESAYASVSPSNRLALTGLTQLSHSYSAEQYYTVTVLAKNAHSNTPVELKFSISGLDCSKPSVNIPEGSMVFTAPVNFFRSEIIRIRGVSTISCAGSYANTKSWRAEEIDPNTNTVLRTVSLSDLDTSKAELTIDPRILDLGLYKIYYQMAMDGSYGTATFEAEAYTYIKVVASELIGVMLTGGVSKVERGAGQTLSLQPLVHSTDPDVEPTAAQGLSVSSWQCHEAEDTSLNCDSIGFDSSGSPTTQTLSISAGVVGKTYKISATLTKDTREIVTEIYLAAVTGTPPFIYIVPAQGSVYYQQSDGFKVLQSSRLALDCVCENCISTDTVAYMWEIYTEDYRWQDGWRQLSPDDMIDRMFGQSSKQISIQDKLFEVFESNVMKVECSVTTSSGTGKVSTKLTVNKPPLPGTCSISPLERTITDQAAWTVSVTDWSDEDGLEEFQFFIHTDDDTADKQITSEPSTGGTFSKNVRLSEGPEYTNYYQDVIVKVRDKLQATRQFPCGRVRVLPMSLEDIRALTKNITSNQLHSLKRMFAEGDQKTCSETSTNIVSLLNSDSKRSRKVYAGYNVASNNANSMYGEIDEDRPSYQQSDPAIIKAETDYKKESERNERATVRRQLIADMTGLNADSVIAIQQVSSFFAEAVVYGDEIDQDSQTTVMNALANMTSTLVNPPENVPSEDLEVAMENGIAAIGGIMDAAGSNGFLGTLDELERATEVEEWKVYDTDLDASAENDELAAAADFEDALKIHTANIHKQRQAKTAEIVRKKVMEAMDMQAQCFSHYSVPGQTLRMNTRKMKVLMEKTDVQTLEGKTLTPPNSNGEVILPNTTLFTGVALDAPVVVSVSQSTNHPLKYSKMAQGIAPESNFISINLYSSGNSKMKVNNLPEPVVIVIPRDTNMEPPDYITVDPMIPSWTNLMNVVVEVNRTRSAVFLDFDDIEDRQFLLVVKKGKVAYIDDTNEGCDSVFLMPTSMTKNLQDPYRKRFFLGDDELVDFTGKLYIGIRELNSTEFDMDVAAGCQSIPRYGNGSDYFRGNFKMRQYVSQCFAISDSEEDWSTSGCKVGKETTPVSTTCRCTHLTTFAGGWVVVPNTIDWSYVFANADFLSNPTIYITVIVTAVLFLAAAIYARLNDKKMAEQLGIAPLADNDPRDKYFYEIIVCTGMRRNAGTNSQACFILSGEDDETDVRAFTDSKRKIFRRGQVDGFLMAVPRPLGYLNFMRVWHDNSGKGKFGSWYLNYIVVRDVQTDTKQVFVANKWLAVEEDDGQVDRVLPVAGKEQLSDFSYQFGERSRKNLADGHLWFSVVARPPQSRFTCLQRVSCCLCLLYVTMLTNAMFYNTTGNDEGSNAFSFGPFTVAPEQITIGIISNLIVFPVNFLLIFLFRKSRPHHKRPSRIDRAIKEVHDSSKQTSINDVKPEVNSIFSVSKTPTIPNDPHRPDSARSTSRPATAMSSGSAQELTAKKKKKFELPWYFTIIAWVLLWIVTLGALAMVVFYGISFKDETCRKWISSMLVSFFMSVFITQPIKVFLFAIILSIIIKNPGEEKDEEEDDEELPHVDADNELLHGDTGYGAARPRKVGYKPPNANQLEKLRQRRIKEIKMWGIVREVIIYSIFLMMLLVISYRQLGASNFLYKDTMHRVFIANNETNIDFHAIRNTKDFWKWTTSGLINGLRAGAYYNDYPPLKLRAFINDKVSRILGYATLRQVRVQPALCEIPDKFEGLIDQCNKKYSIKDQVEETFKPGWQPMGAGDTENDTRQEYRYTKAGDLNGYPYWGTLSVYSGGGYVLPLEGSKTDLQTMLQQLEREEWIDKYTRAVFVEFTVYNAQVNLFAISTILCEFDPAGGTVVSFRFEPAMLLPYMSDAMLFQVVCEIAYIVFTLFFIVREVKSLIKTRLAYFQNFWNLVEVGIIGMSIATIVIFFYRMVVTNGLTKDFKSTNGNGYIKFQYVGYWNEMFSYMIGFLVFLATLKFLKLLRFNRKISMLSATLRHAAKSLLHFGVIFFIVFLAFSQLFYLTYMHIDVDYSTFISSVVATILMMMGKFNIYSMIMAEPILTQIFVLLFVIMVTFIIVNMFVSILNETFTVVREDVKKQGNDYEVIDFMLQRFKKWTGIGKSTEETQQEDDPNDPVKGRRPTGNTVEDFPDRIERLLQSISTVYMDNDNLTQLYQKKQYDSRNAKDMLRQGATGSQFGGPMGIGARKESTAGVPKVHTH